MACCLKAPSHYFNQCWLIISKVQWHSSEGNFTRDSPSVIKISMKITCLTFPSNLLVANEHDELTPKEDQNIHITLIAHSHYHSCWMLMVRQASSRAVCRHDYWPCSLPGIFGFQLQKWEKTEITNVCCFWLLLIWEHLLWAPACLHVTSIL